MKFLAAFWTILAATASGHACAKPAGPPLTFLLSANVTAAPKFVVGPEALGTRVGLPIAGGTFAGPYLNGTFLPLGVDLGILTDDGKFYPNGVAYLNTTDGAIIVFRDQGYQADGAIYGSVSFETGYEKYKWLNTVVAISSAALTPSGSGSGVGLDIFIVSAMS
jgi:hypothetical protein